MTTVVGGSGETTDIDSTTNTEQNTSSTAEESTVTSQQNTSTTTASTNTQQTVSQLKPISIIEVRILKLSKAVFTYNAY